MIPYGHQSIAIEDIKEVIKVLQSDWLTQGPKIKEFEKALAKYCGAKYAVAVCNGTAALHLAYLVAGFKAGEEVITTPNTFVATTNMLLALGVKPRFCDTRLDTYNLDETKIRKLISSKTKAIVPMHFAGQPCEMDQIIKIAKRFKLLVIEDAAHALGAEYKGKKIGSLNSDLAIFSFHPVKSITTGEGGAIITNNIRYYKKLLLLRSHGLEKDKNGFNVMRHLGFNYRMTDMQAALGISQLKKISHFINQRRRVVGWYSKYLSDCHEIILPEENEKARSSWHLYVIRVKNSRLRNSLLNYLKKNGIGVNFHYSAVYFHPYYRQHGYAQVNLKEMQKYHLSALTIPCHAQLKEKEIKFIAKKIKDFF